MPCELCWCRETPVYIVLHLEYAFPLALPRGLAGMRLACVCDASCKAWGQPESAVAGVEAIAVWLSE